MKRALQLIVSFLLAILALILAVSSCAPQSALGQQAAPTEALETAEVTPEPTVEPSAEPAEEPPVEDTEAASVETDAPAEPSAEPEPTAAPATLSMAEMTPAERAAFWGLPEPPEGIDLDTREFLIANSYNNITKTRPSHAYGAGVTVDICAAEAFNKFVEAARAAGYDITAFLGYLDWWTVLENYYEPQIFAHNAVYAASVTFVPGCNDHQTATCVDLRLGKEEDFRGTEAWDWLIEHCADYGMILRYPEGQSGWYGYACMHPAHFRYVGVDAAKYIMENNITLEQFVLLYDWEFIYVPGLNDAMP